LAGIETRLPETASRLATFIGVALGGEILPFASDFLVVHETTGAHRPARFNMTEL
jgi:hypothetical protein